MTEDEKRVERFHAIRKIYTLVLKEKWHIINFHDKFYPRDTVFLLWKKYKGSDQKTIIRIPA